MKKTIKLTFAALAVFSLASCSGDDLFGNGNPLQQNEKTLTVEVEDMIDPLTTRAAYASGARSTTWQIGDQIRVYDDALVKYDVYKYGNSKFTSVEKTNVIKTPKYALFAPTAGAAITKSGWDYNAKESYVVYSIDKEWAWAEDTKTDNTQVLYQSNIPQWGEVSVNSDNELESKLNILTGAIRLTLKNVPNNIEAIQIEAFEDKEGNTPAPISGDFKAVIETIEGAQTNAVLVPYKEDGNVYNTITVNFKDKNGKWLATQAESQVIIPMIVNTYNLLKINYKEAEGDGSWIPAKILETTVPINRGTLQPIGLTGTPLDGFEFAGKDIPALNAALAAQKGSTTLVTITAGKTTEVKADANKIIIPKGMTADINLDLQGGLSATGTDVLEVVSEDGAYAGNLTIQVPGDVDEETGLDSHKQDKCGALGINNVYVNMPKANVTFAGNWYDADLGKVDHDEAKVLKVNTLTLAKGATVKGIYPNATCCEGNSADADILVAEDAQVRGTGVNVGLVLSAATAIDKITVNGEVKGTLDAAVKNMNEQPIVVDVTLGEGATVGTMNTYQAEVTVPAKASVTTLTSYNGANVTVQGKVTTLNSYKGGSVYVNGDAGEIGTLNGDKEITGYVDGDKVVGYLEIKGKGKVGTANVRGASVFVSRSESGIAITNALNMGDGKVLNLKGGYIKVLNGAGTDATNTGITIKNEEANNVATAIATVNNVKLAAPIVSKWGGAVIGTDNASKPYYFTNTNEIWTASQFAYYTGATAVKLGADIDMNNKPFTPKAAVKTAFNGNDKTISNVSIERDVTNGAAGLFLSLTADGSISNLKVNGIKIEQKKTTTTIPTTSTYYVVGGLVANASGGSIEAVDVANAELTNANWTVGGLIGNVTGEVTITGSRAKTNDYAAKTYSTVAAKSITGKNRLGGIVGQISTGGKVTIAGYKADVTKFTVTEELNEGMTNRLNFGTVAPFVGTATAGELSVTTGTAYATTPLTYAQKLALGFDNNQKVEVADNTMAISYYYFVGRVEIGYVGADFKLGTNSYSSTSSNLEAKVKKAADVNKTAALNYYLLSTEYK